MTVYQGKLTPFTGPGSVVAYTRTASTNPLYPDSYTRVASSTISSKGDYKLALPKAGTYTLRVSTSQAAYADFTVTAAAGRTTAPLTGVPEPTYRNVPTAPQAGSGGGGGSASAAGVTASSAREEVYPYLPKPYPATQVSASMTVWPDTSAQWAASLVALGENSRLGFVAQVPSNATEPLKVAEGTSQGDSYNPSASRTDVPAGSEVVLSAGNTFLTAHFTTASQPVRIKQITGV